jgi:hypothetical protein
MFNHSHCFASFGVLVGSLINKLRVTSTYIRHTYICHVAIIDTSTPVKLWSKSMFDEDTPIKVIPHRRPR